MHTLRNETSRAKSTTFGSVIGKMDASEASDVSEMRRYLVTAPFVQTTKRDAHWQVWSHVSSMPRAASEPDLKSLAVFVLNAA